MTSSRRRSDSVSSAPGSGGAISCTGASSSLPLSAHTASPARGSAAARRPSGAARRGSPRDRERADRARPEGGGEEGCAPSWTRDCAASRCPSAVQGGEPRCALPDFLTSRSASSTPRELGQICNDDRAQMGLSGRVAIAPEPLRVTRERSRSSANQRPSMYASRKLHLDGGRGSAGRGSGLIRTAAQAAIYGDYYADRKWSRQWLPGFGFGSSTRIDRWARKYCQGVPADGRRQGETARGWRARSKC